MAHEIVNEQIAWANQVPWHGLGVEMDPSASAQDFLRAAKLDWEVQPHEIWAEIEGERVLVPNKAAFIRSTDRKVMTVASPNWKPFQNAEALDFMQRYVSAGGAQMEVVGALRDGAMIWGLARLGHEFETRPGDRSVGYLLLQSPHEVGKSIQVSTTSVRVVCANTMALAENSKSLHYRQSHVKEFDVDAAKAMVEAAHEQLAEAERRSKTLDKLKLSIEDAVLKVLAPALEPKWAEDPDLLATILEPDVTPRSIEGVMESILRGPGAIPDTGWGVLAGATHYLDHVAGRSNETRWAGAVNGPSGSKKLEIERRLLELAA